MSQLTLALSSLKLVIMDLSMPGMSGLIATRKLKQLCPDVSIVALTRHADEGYLQELLRAGVSGYVLKQSPHSELLHAIRAAATGAGISIRRSRGTWPHRLRPAT